MTARATPADQLRTAVRALTRPTRRKIMRDAVDGQPPRTITVYVPSLVDQLDDAREQGQQSGGAGGSVPGSRPPTGEDAMLVRLAIEAGTAHRRALAGLDQRDDVGTALVGLAEHLIARGDDDQVAELADLVRGWVRQALGALDISYAARGLRGVPCPMPACGRAWVDGEDGREYALILVFSDGGMTRAAQCRACGAVWWRGEALAKLGAYVRSLDADAVLDAAADDRLQ